MKRCTLLVLLVLVSHIFALATDTNLCNANADPEIVTVEVDRGTTVQQLPAQRFVLTDVIPGEAPEGDFCGGVTYTNDGEQVVLTNRVSNNVSFYDAETMEILANVDVGDYPQSVAVTDDYAVVPCVFSDEVWVVDLEDYTVAATFDVNEQPAIVEVSPSGQYAYVGCDIDDVLEIIDLTTLTHVGGVTNFYMALMSFWSTPAYGRGGYDFTNFEVLSDNTTIAFGDWDTQVRIVDTSTGTTLNEIAVDDVRRVHLSGDATKLVAVSGDHVTQIDLTTMQADSEVSFGGATVGAHYEAGVTQTGDKAFVAISGNESAIVRFDTQDYVTFSSTYSAFWIGMNTDRTVAISGQYRLSLIDMENETLLDQHVGVQKDYGAVSPVDDRLVSYTSNYEGLTWFTFDNNSISYAGRTLAGAAPEGDTPLRIAVTPDGTTALAAGPLGCSVCVIDMTSGETTDVIELDIEPRDVAISPDGDWAVVTAFSYMTPYSDGLAYIIDMSDYSVVAELDTGQRPFTVIMSSDGSRAYVANIQGNSITAITMAGAASSVAGNVSCGTIGVLYTHYSTYSGMTLSPDDETLLVCASFNDALTVIDTDELSVVASLPVDDFPIDAAFSGDGQYAMVANCFDNTCTICQIDGASSSVVGSVSPGEKPLHCVTNPSTGDVGVVVCNESRVIEYQLPAGVVSTIHNIQGEGNVYLLQYDPVGQPMVLGSESLVYGDESVPIGGAADFAYYEPDFTVIACTPSQDMIHHVTFDPVGRVFGDVELLGVDDYSGVRVDLVEHGEWMITGPSGEYAFYDVPAGTYTVQFTIEDWEDTSIECEIAEGETVQLGTTTLELTPREIVEIDAAITDDNQIELQFTLEGNELWALAPVWLYVLLDGDQGTPDVWTLWDNDISITEPYVTDFSLEEGDYVFATIHEYTGGVFTEPVFSNVVHWPGVGVNDTPEAVTTALLPNTPNPFNPSTTVRFSLARAGDVSLRAYDIRGRLVETLAETRFDAGEHAIVWNAEDCASGVYLLRLEADGKVMTRRAVLLK